MSIRGAVRADMDTLMTLYNNARAAMAAAGNPNQWINGYPQPELIEQDILSNRQFLVVHRGEIQGTFSFAMGPDPTYAAIDGAWLDDTRPYGVVHHVACTGKGDHVADKILAWAMEHCDSLRIDTHADNKPMQHILEKNGFTKCGVIITHNGTPRHAYQKVSF